MIASIILDQSFKHPLDYFIPAALSSQITIGTMVEVPLRSSLKHGTVIAIRDGASSHPLKTIQRVLSETPLLSPELMQLALWMSNYYCAPLGEILKTMLPRGVRKQTAIKQQFCIKRAVSSERMAKAIAAERLKAPVQAAILEELLKKDSIPQDQLLKKINGSHSSIKALIKKGFIKKEALERSFLEEASFFQVKPKKLSEEQASALAKITESLSRNEYAAHLLFGVTGSGKTEIYLQAIASALGQGKTTLMLIPEISLTTQTIERFRSRFNEPVSVLHHRLSAGQKYEAWQKIQKGEVRIVIGARSAAFCPLPNLGLIIVDEEHENSYKQNELAPSYHAREVAVMRANLSKATVILGSATPSLESFYNAQTSKYTLVKLSLRPDQACLPEIKIIDMRKEFEKAQGFTLFSEALLNAIEKKCRAGEQAILFLNRRGYHSAMLCTGCGASVKCPNCDLSLTFHRNDNCLTCHLCGHLVEPPPRFCAECRAENPLKFRGVGTEQVEAALHAIFPEIKVLRLDADTTEQHGSHQKIYRAFRSGKADVLVGTQMVAKGLHFPNVTLVGVLNSDISLNIPDFRAGETTFQLLTQVAGRAGRSALRGDVIIQTSIPDNEVIQAAAKQDYTAFYLKEIEIRKQFAYPPFASLVKLRFSGSCMEKLQLVANRFRNEALNKLPAVCEATPITLAGHSKVKSQYRVQFLLKGPKMSLLTEALQQLQKSFYLPKNVKLLIDINPLSTYF